MQYICPKCQTEATVRNKLNCHDKVRILLVCANTECGHEFYVEY